MTQLNQAAAGEWYYPYWSVIPPYRQWPVFYPTQYVTIPPQTVTTNKTFWDHIEIAKEAREAGKQMRRYRKIR